MMMHMNLLSQKTVSWGIRLVAAYLFFWWTILYLGYASLEPLGIRDVLAAIFLGSLYSLGLFLSSFNQKKITLYLVTMPLIAIELWLFITSLLSKVLIVDTVGIFGGSLSIIYILKTNKTGGLKWQTL